MYYKKNKRKEPTMYNTKFLFFNQGVQYACLVEAPITIPKYRLKEIVDRTFVGKKVDMTKAMANPFFKLSEDITYSIISVKDLQKETENE